MYIVTVGDKNSMESWIEAVFSTKEKAYAHAKHKLFKHGYRINKVWCSVEVHEVDSEAL